MDGGAGSLVTSAGTWTFNTAVSGGYAAELNGHEVATNPPTLELEVANQGQLYANNSDGSWWLWNGAGWAPATNPTPPTPSADGSILMDGGAGSLVTSAGTWTFNTAVSGGYAAELNGHEVATNPPTLELEVANQGQLYANNSDGSWWLWNGAGWAPATNPTAPTSPTPSADGSILMDGGAGSLVTSAGTWTFNTAVSGGYAAELNGHEVATNPPTLELEVANQGQLYANNSDGSWWLWNGAGWAPATNQTAPTSPTPS